MNLSSCLGLLFAALLVAAGDASAQAAPSGPAASKDAKDSKEAKDGKDAKAADAEAMERARRLAANPMRIILEASRVRRREGDAAPGSPIVPVVATTATAPAGVVAAPPAEVAPRSAPAPAPAPAPTPVREAPPPEPAAAVISSELTQSRATTAPALALDNAAVARPVAPTTTPALPTLAALPADMTRPTLIRRVDPEPPSRLLADIEPNTVISADLTIRTDGSVAQVTLVSANTRALGRYVVSALQQWRFAPLPSERVWRIDLLFRPDE